MVATATLDELRSTIAAAPAVAAVGSRTHWEVGGPPPAADVVLVGAPDGIAVYDPADLTVTVGAGTRCDDLAEVLAEHSQECPLDPRDPSATVGGLLATGLSGHRRLRYGPVRDRVLEVRFVAADGRVVKGGGPTVKNVSGFDLPRLLVGSMGTVGLLVQVTLRCQPRPAQARWWNTPADPFALRRALYRPSCITWDGVTTHVLLEGLPADLAAEQALVEDATPAAPPPWPDAQHRGRISVRPGAVRSLADALDAAGVQWLAEVGVGTIHVAATSERALAAARAAARTAGGWLLREAGAPTLDGYGTDLPAAALNARLRAAFDPDGKWSPGRLPSAASGASDG